MSPVFFNDNHEGTIPPVKIQSNEEIVAELISKLETSEEKVEAVNYFCAK